jgi:hypothetical protein
LGMDIRLASTNMCMLWIKIPAWSRISAKSMPEPSPFGSQARSLASILKRGGNESSNHGVLISLRLQNTVL